MRKMTRKLLIFEAQVMVVWDSVLVECATRKLSSDFDFV
jgi:hypothetical protein